MDDFVIDLQQSSGINHSTEDFLQAPTQNRPPLTQLSNAPLLSLAGWSGTNVVIVAIRVAEID